MSKIDYLLAQVGGAPLALPLDLVLSVSEAERATALPFSPRFVIGLVFVQDRVLPLMDLAEVLRRPRRDRGDTAASLVIAAVGDDVRALDVEAVRAMVAIEADTIGDIAEADRTHPLLTRGFDHGGSFWPVFDYLAFVGETALEADGVGDAAALVPLDALGEEEAAEPDAAEAETCPCLMVAVAGDLYAVATADIAEIVVSTDLRVMPGAPDFVRGLLDRRDTPVLALDTARLLGTGRRDAADGIALVIEPPDRGTAFALIVDRALGIVRIPASRIFDVEADMAGVARYWVQDERIVGLLSPPALVRQIGDDLACLTPEPRALAQALSEPLPETLPDAAADKRPVLANRRQMLSLRLGDNYYCLDLDRVDRILSAVTLSPLPGGGNGFDGLADVGDQVVPVKDLRRSFSVPLSETSPPCILLQLEGSTAALAVDQVLRIEDVMADAIDEVVDDPDLPIHAVARVGDRLMAVLTVDRLLPPPTIAAG